ncbi:hypothetical protein [Embleya sp. NPDC005971]|uniref:hypothetical protein n=1 Tax=Embleya sp. NPDC005971 TaxID=3156724 RepID=UPI0033DB252D
MTLETVTSTAPADRPRRHDAARPGIHWRYAPDSTELHLDVPDSRHPAWQTVKPLAHTSEATYLPAFAPDHRDVVLAALREAFGRTGLEPIAYVDVDLRLDTARPQHDGTCLRWAGVMLAATGEHHSWRGKVQLHRADVIHGALLTEGEGGERRVAWEPGTVVRVRDVPRPSLAGHSTDAYTTVADTDDDPLDALRREGHRVFGLRHHHDIPPAPDDASPGRPPRMANEWPATMRVVPTDYPCRDVQQELVVDPAAGLVYVYRSVRGGFHTCYVVPLTPERAAVIDAYDEAFERSPVAYATVGADAEAAALLARGGYTPQRVHDVRALFAIDDADDARALLARSKDEWGAAGWEMHRAVNPATAPLWRATDAQALADAGIGAHRAYELRTGEDGHPRDVVDAIATHASTPNAAGRAAVALLKGIPNVDELRERLSMARTHTVERREEWTFEPMDLGALMGISRSGMSVGMDEHRFTMADRSTASLWTVVDHWWAYDGEGDAGGTETVHLTEPEARTAWREARDDAKARTTPPAPRPEPADDHCPGPDVEHCDNCGATQPNNPWLDMGWMLANLGRACSPHCHGEMSDARGEHARRHHRHW